MRNNKQHTLTQALAILTLACASQTASAVEALGMEWEGSGFMTLAAGRIVGGNSNNDYNDFNGYNAPAFVADFGQAGIYEKNQGWSLAPDSKLGLQAKAKINPQWSITGQIVTRGAANMNTNLEWLFASYNINDNWTVQLGRKRLPLFYYSESQDVGLSMPWVRLPPQAYGWDIVNYNGINLMNKAKWGDWSATTEFFYGNEKRDDNPYQKIYTGKHSKTNEKWSDIAGADITLSQDWFEARFMYLQSYWAYWEAGTASQALPKSRQKYYSAAFNADYENWMVRTEFSYINRRPVDENDFAQMVGVGYRIGKWLPMVTVARYEGNYIEGAYYSTLNSEKHTTYTLSLRYDLSPSSAVKIQYDYWKDRGGTDFNSSANIYGVSENYGNPRLLSISYDLVF